LPLPNKWARQSDPRKVNVCVGAYRDERGLPWVLPSVRRAEERMLHDPIAHNKEYLPIEGDRDFVGRALRFAYGPGADPGRVAGVQTLSGTGACRIGGHFLARHLGRPAGQVNIYIPVPTWGNHWAIFRECGLNARPYRYYSRATNGLDLDGMLEDLEEAEAGSVVLLHACAHNPTVSL
jgi:aspartate aminotransferase